MKQTKLLFPLIFISLEDDSSIVIPTQPTSPGEIMSGGEGEPVEADEPEEGENDTTPAETERTISGVLASTETVTHEYLTQSGKVVRETITTSMDTTTLDFFYDESGRPFAFNYTPEGSTPNTYYYILNLQGDVVQIIDDGGVLQAEYVYSPWARLSLQRVIWPRSTRSGIVDTIMIVKRGSIICVLAIMIRRIIVSLMRIPMPAQTRVTRLPAICLRTATITRWYFLTLLACTPLALLQRL